MKSNLLKTVVSVGAAAVLAAGLTATPAYAADGDFTSPVAGAEYEIGAKVPVHLEHSSIAEGDYITFALNQDGDEDSGVGIPATTDGAIDATVTIYEDEAVVGPAVFNAYDEDGEFLGVSDEFNVVEYNDSVLEEAEIVVPDSVGVGETFTVTGSGFPAGDPYTLVGGQDNNMGPITNQVEVEIAADGTFSAELAVYSTVSPDVGAASIRVADSNNYLRAIDQSITLVENEDAYRLTVTPEKATQSESTAGFDFTLANLQEGDNVTLSLRTPETEGDEFTPLEGIESAEAGDYTGTLTWRETDQDGNVIRDNLEFPVGVYTVFADIEGYPTQVFGTFEVTEDEDTGETTPPEEPEEPEEPENPAVPVDPAPSDEPGVDELAATGSDSAPAGGIAAAVLAALAGAGLLLARRRKSA